MKIFISWSEEPSRKLAELLEGWIPNVIQTVECFLSSTGIRAGDRWNEEINTQLEHTDFGILCVTPGNIKAPWLNYEAGALAKRVTERSRVVPITMGFAPSTLPAPLRQFNGVTDDEAGFKSLITSIAEAAKSPVNVDEVFGVWWPVLEPKLAALVGLTDQATPPPSPSTDEVLSEVLGIVQGLQLDVARIRHSKGTARPIETSDVASLTRLMMAEPDVLDRVASGDPRFIRQVLNHARRIDSGWGKLNTSESIRRSGESEVFRQFREADAAREAMSDEYVAGDDPDFLDEKVKQ
ncbi:toll/interleukin-1 receptor domain-containing protein [Microbacterium sp. 3H14]|uniref:toll/interleukin-1 receptor domain-containing protein n=1 Tax=Microbacterium sp. 3H14 TaxID=2555725 RepID=UPI00106A2F35|nr:toll/interleukin-1 receptor domain-containing protein [Microbacterium sp. 3H14]TFB15439.1 toll/interleukin-1 receptor domain-containing protein [Microbacterium sp. 3H14]